MASDELTGKELQSALWRLDRLRVSDDQLRHLRRGGLIKRPRPRPTAGDVGISQVYPAGTLEQLRGVARLRHKAWRFDELRVVVFLEGLWVEPTMLLASFRRLLEDQVVELREIYEASGRDPSEAALRVVERMRAEVDSRHPVLRLMRRRLGRDREALDTVIYVVFVYAFGGEPIWDSRDVGLDEPESSPRELFDRALGIDRLLVADAGSGPWLPERPDTPHLMRELRDVGMFDVLDPAAAFDGASWDQLVAARERARVVYHHLSTAAQAAEQMLGSDFGGLGLFRTMRQRESAALSVMILRYALLLPRLGHEEAIRKTAAALATQYPIFRAVLDLTDALPGYRQYLTPAGVAKLDELPPAELEAFRSLFADYVTKNPDAARALGLAQE